MSTDFHVSRNGRSITARIAGGQVYLEVSHHGLRTTTPRPLVLETSLGNLLEELTVESSKYSTIVESYELAVGKRIGRHDVEQSQLELKLATKAGISLKMLLRAADDGVAYRWILPNLGEGASIAGSDVSFEFETDSACWPLNYTPWYEEPRISSTIGELEDTEVGYGLPMLVSQAGSFILLAESDVNGRYGGAHLTKSGNEFAYTLSDPVHLRTQETSTPWRVFFLGDLAEIVSSSLVEDLAPSASEPMPEWVRPGKGPWSWWSDFYSGAQFDVQKKLVDYAAEHGWDHVLVDCGWDRSWLPELVAYASARGIGIFVWVSWDWLKVDTELQEWAAWGVAGIKPDFMESESQARYEWYDLVIAECARVGLMINFHGSVIPRGWARTHPQVVSYEAVRGAEYYVFYDDPFDAAVHNTIVPFTRNVVGSADYTPVAFSARKRETTEAHELALSIVLESGVTNFADAIEEYQKRPLAEKVLDAIFTAWDETRLLGGYPGEWVAMGRRRGSDWFIGVISAGTNRTVTFDSPGGEFDLISDANGSLAMTGLEPSGTTFTLSLQANGGAVLLPKNLKSVASPPNPLEAPILQSDLVVADVGADVPIVVRSGRDGLVAKGPKGWTLTPTADGWVVSVPTEALAGSVATFGVRKRDSSKRSPVAHFRIVVAPRIGTTYLVEADPIAAANQFGPVERNQSNGGGDPFDGNAMCIGGTTADSGFGVSAPSSIGFALGGLADRFTGTVGIDDETPNTAATARLVGDGNVLASVDLFSGSQPVEISADLAGIQRLNLEVVQGPGKPAHVDWVSPQIHRK